MNIILQDKARFFDDPEGRRAWIYGFSEYEFQYDEQQSRTVLKWHHHEKIWETIYIIEGELINRRRANHAVERKWGRERASCESG